MASRSRSPRRCGGRILPVLRMQRVHLKQELVAFQESFKLLACENCNNCSEAARQKGMTIARSCHADFQSCQHLPTVSFGKFYSGRATVESGRLQSDALVVTPPVVTCNYDGREFRAHREMFSTSSSEGPERTVNHLRPYSFFIRCFSGLYSIRLVSQLFNRL